MIQRTLAAVFLLGLSASLGGAQETPERPSGSALIDRWIRAQWTERELKPAPRSEDMEFLRRASLDIVGVIPSLEEAERYLADPDPDKRRKLVDALLKSPKYADHWADVWASILLGSHSTAPQDQILYFKARSALKALLERNLPYDEFARTLLTAKGSVYPLPQAMAAAGAGAPEESGLAMYVYKAFREAQRDLPKALAGKMTRTFMGVQIQCAQCHDHPFDRWTQEEFYGMASFFTEVLVRRETLPDKNPPAPGQPAKPPQFYFTVDDRTGPGSFRRGPGMGPGMGLGMDLVIPDSKAGPVRASFLETRKGVVRGTPRRAQFAQYMTSKENLQFARMAVNRLWAHFFGSGIVNPPDDFSGKNKPTHPELLDELARDFIEHGFDTHYLIRSMAMSESYGLTSRSKERLAAQEKYFALSRVRALSPEQILRSIFQAVGSGRAGLPRAPEGQDPRRRGLFFLAAQFRYAFGDDEGGEVTDFTGSIPSALLMMNSDLVGRGTSTRLEGTLSEVLRRSPVPEDRIRSLFLLALSRPPSARELERWKSGMGDPKGTAGYEDLLWTLLNSSEFLFNH
jgi:hypothetical protein